MLLSRFDYVEELLQRSFDYLKVFSFLDDLVETLKKTSREHGVLNWVLPKGSIWLNFLWAPLEVSYAFSVA